MKKELKHFKFEDFETISDKIDEYLSEFTDSIIDLLPQDADIQGIDYLLYEILINAYKHSKFEKAYLKINTPTNEENINIHVYDNGIGIQGSFKESLMESANDCEALYEAINGKTTDKERYGLHGRGLNSAARITTLGFNGEMIISSGRGVCVITKKGAKTYLNPLEIKGTFVSLKIQNRKVDNIYEYLRHENINRIKDD